MMYGDSYGFSLGTTEISLRWASSLNPSPIPGQRPLPHVEVVYPPLHDVEELEILRLGRKRFKIKVLHQQWLLKPCSEVVVSNIFYFDPYLGKWSNLTNIIEMGWNHQLDVGWFNINISFALSFKPRLWGKKTNSATGNC